MITFMEFYIHFWQANKGAVKRELGHVRGPGHHHHKRGSPPRPSTEGEEGMSLRLDPRQRIAAAGLNRRLYLPGDRRPVLVGGWVDGCGQRVQFTTI